MTSWFFWSNLFMQHKAVLPSTSNCYLHTTLVTCFCCCWHHSALGLFGHWSVFHDYFSAVFRVNSHLWYLYVYSDRYLCTKYLAIWPFAHIIFAKVWSLQWLHYLDFVVLCVACGFNCAHKYRKTCLTDNSKGGSSCSLSSVRSAGRTADSTRTVAQTLMLQSRHAEIGVLLLKTHQILKV